jgi:DNA replication protein DnaC
MIADPSLPVLLRSLKLPGFVAHHGELADRARDQGWSFEAYLRQLVDIEVENRAERRLERNLKASKLPAEKTLANLERTSLPEAVQRHLPTLCEGAFTSDGSNLLLFGRPGRGKTHIACAVGHELVRRGRRVRFYAAYELVQELLAARRDLQLPQMLRRLDRFDAVIVDDIGYVQQTRDETEVLFTFLAERYERRSVIITSNLVFSEWDRIFKDPMTTACAIDRLVHHAVILELTGPSWRAEHAKRRQADQGADS